MIIRCNLEELKSLMRSLFTVSGIRFVLFDTDYNRLISYPENDCEFCAVMKRSRRTFEKCASSDRKSFEECSRTNKMFLYKCHAGLVEAATALKENDRIIGYLMFGQVTDNPDLDGFRSELYDYCSGCGLNGADVADKIDKLVYKSDEQISAAAKIMEVCTSYILLKELVAPETDHIFEAAKEYIESHLSEDFGIPELCGHLRVSRTRLYEVFKKELHTGISSYIRRRRMHRAKELLKTTEKPVWEIAQAVGFSDYNYFSRVYKRVCGKSPGKYRKE